MCSTKQEVTDIINTALAQHELGDIQRYVQLEDKMDRTLVAVRDSIPPAFSPYLLCLTEKINFMNDMLTKTTQDHEGRLRKQEHIMTYYMGVFVGIGFIGAIVWNVIWSFIKEKLLQ